MTDGITRTEDTLAVEQSDGRPRERRIAKSITNARPTRSKSDNARLDAVSGDRRPGRPADGYTSERGEKAVRVATR